MGLLCFNSIVGLCCILVDTSVSCPEHAAPYSLGADVHAAFPAGLLSRLRRPWQQPGGAMQQMPQRPRGLLPPPPNQLPSEKVLLDQCPDSLWHATVTTVLLCDTGWASQLVLWHEPAPSACMSRTCYIVFCAEYMHSLHTCNVKPVSTEHAEQ